MTFHGRSLDDLPLAAYSTGAEPDARLEDEAPADPAAPPAPAFAPATHGAPAFDVGAAGSLAGVGGRRLAIPALPAIPPWLANPRAHLRDPRLLLTGVVGAVIVVLVVSVALGGGPGAGAGGPGASASTAPVVVATVAPPSGNAEVEVSGKLTGSYALVGATGTGPATGSRIATTWTDAGGASLELAGPASPGTRTTDATFTLTWTVLVDGAPVTFTSADGECTVGMAVQPRTVSGSFTCKQLRSGDGKLIVDLRGTYRT